MRRRWRKAGRVRISVEFAVAMHPEMPLTDHDRCPFNTELPLDKVFERAGRIAECFLRAFRYEQTEQKDFQ